MMDDILMTARDIALMLRMSPSHVAERITHRPDFPKPYRLGRVRRWAASDIRAWIEARREKQVA